MIQFVTSTIVALSLTVAGNLQVYADNENIIVEQFWARATIGMRRPGVAYMTILNNGITAIQLQNISTPIAKKAEVHRTEINDEGVSSMTQVDELIIEPGEAAKLEPGGLHVMLMQLQSTMIEGNSLPLLLEFSDRSSVEIVVPILNIAARGPSDR